MALCLLSGSAGASTVDTGKVGRLYVQSTGAIAIQLDSGFTNATAASQCPSASGWAGHLSADAVLKSVLIAAKSTGQTIAVTVDGCETTGWFKIVDVYVN